MKTKQTFLLALALLVSIVAFSQVSVSVDNTVRPDESAMLTLESKTAGFLPPRMTESEVKGISNPAAGLVVYNTTAKCLQWWNGATWIDGCTRRDSSLPDPLPAEITLTKARSSYIIASALDSDYINGTGAMPNNTTVAQLRGGTEDVALASTNDTPIDIQGTITTTGVTIRIPYTVINASITLPEFSQTITIPASFTENGVATDLTFSYPTQFNLAVGTGFIDATLKAESNDFLAPKLDLNSGFGADYLGLLLGKFTYALDSAGSVAELDIRVLPGIPDLNFGDNVHDFIYLPIVSQTGKRWLNNNLGADYANTRRHTFDPAQQATAADDWKAYGSLFQWGRVADGHEIIEAWSATAGTAAEGTTNVLSPTPIPSHKLFITAGGEWYNGTTPDKKELWLITVKTIYDPCPNGYRVPTPAEFTAERNAPNFTPNSLTGGFNSDLKLSGVGRRSHQNGSIISPGTSGYYWTSGNVPVIHTSLQHSQHFVMTDGDLQQAQMSSQVRGTGSGIRCIEE